MEKWWILSLRNRTKRLFFWRLHPQRTTWSEIHRDGCTRHRLSIHYVHTYMHYVANRNGILANSTMISRLSANTSDSRAPTSVAQTRKRIVKSSYLLQHRDTACGKRRMRMRLVYTYEEVGVYVMIVCTRARTAWMNVARKSLREICYFRRDCVLSTCLYTGCHWISGLKFASVFFTQIERPRIIGTFSINCALINYLDDMPSQ